MAQSKQGMIGGVTQVVAGVRKVVDELDNVNVFQGISNDILKPSTELPMTAEGITQIVAASSQSGIAKSKLLDFSKSTAQMGIAGSHPFLSLALYLALCYSEYRESAVASPTLYFGFIEDLLLI